MHLVKGFYRKIHNGIEKCSQYVKSKNQVNKQFVHHNLIFVKIAYIVDTLKYTYTGASLVAQWLRICLPVQGTRVRVLVWEDPTCRGASRPVSHNY